MQLQTSEVGIGSKEQLFFPLPSITFHTSSSESAVNLLNLGVGDNLHFKSNLSQWKDLEP